MLELLLLLWLSRLACECILRYLSYRIFGSENTAGKVL